MSSLRGDFGGKVDFDVLHFTNSSNASSLIVRSSRAQIKYTILNS
jgi:hypothetical protein